MLVYLFLIAVILFAIDDFKLAAIYGDGTVWRCRKSFSWLGNGNKLSYLLMLVKQAAHLCSFYFGIRRIK